jgi:hypothetical protein
MYNPNSLHNAEFNNTEQLKQQFEITTNGILAEAREEEQIKIANVVRIELNKIFSETHADQPASYIRSEISLSWLIRTLKDVNTYGTHVAREEFRGIQMYNNVNNGGKTPTNAQYLWNVINNLESKQADILNVLAEIIEDKEGLQKCIDERKEFSLAHKTQEEVFSID